MSLVKHFKSLRLFMVATVAEHDHLTLSSGQHPLAVVYKNQEDFFQDVLFQPSEGWDKAHALYEVCLDENLIRDITSDFLDWVCIGIDAGEYGHFGGYRYGQNPNCAEDKLITRFAKQHKISLPDSYDDFESEPAPSWYDEHSTYRVSRGSVA